MPLARAAVQAYIQTAITDRGFGVQLCARDRRGFDTSVGVGCSTRSRCGVCFFLAAAESSRRFSSLPSKNTAPGSQRRWTPKCCASWPRHVICMEKPLCPWRHLRHQSLQLQHRSLRLVQRSERGQPPPQLANLMANASHLVLLSVTYSCRHRLRAFENASERAP